MRLNTFQQKLVIAGCLLRFSTKVENREKSTLDYYTADIEYVNYKGAKMKADDKNDAAAGDLLFISLTKVIDNLYKKDVNFRVSGEVKFNTVM